MAQQSVHCPAIGLVADAREKWGGRPPRIIALRRWTLCRTPGLVPPTKKVCYFVIRQNYLSSEGRGNSASRASSTCRAVRHSTVHPHAQLRHPVFGHWDYRPFIGQIGRCQTLFTCPAVGTSFLKTCPNRSMQQAHQGVSGAFTSHVFLAKCDNSKVYLLNHANRVDLEQAGSPSRSLQTGPS